MHFSILLSLNLNLFVETDTARKLKSFIDFKIKQLLISAVENIDLNLKGAHFMKHF